MHQDGELSLYQEESDEYKDMYVDVDSELFEIFKEAEENEADIKVCVVSAMGKEQILDHKISGASR